MPEVCFEGAGKGLAGAETDTQRNVQDRRLPLPGEAGGGDFEAAPAQVVAEGFAHPGGEYAVEMEGRKMGDLGQLRHFQRGVEVGVDMVEDAVHPLRVGSERGQPFAAAGGDAGVGVLAGAGIARAAPQAAGRLCHFSSTRRWRVCRRSR